MSIREHYFSCFVIADNSIIDEVSLRHRCLSTYPLPWAPCKFSITLECYLGNVAIWTFWKDLLLRKQVLLVEAQLSIFAGAKEAPSSIADLSQSCKCKLQNQTHLEHTLCSVLGYEFVCFSLLFFKNLMELCYSRVEGQALAKTLSNRLVLMTSLGQAVQQFTQ